MSYEEPEMEVVVLDAGADVITLSGLEGGDGGQTPFAADTDSFGGGAIFG